MELLVEEVQPAVAEEGVCCTWRRFLSHGSFSVSTVAPLMRGPLIKGHCVLPEVGVGVL